MIYQSPPITNIALVPGDSLELTFPTTGSTPLPSSISDITIWLDGQDVTKLIKPLLNVASGTVTFVSPFSVKNGQAISVRWTEGKYRFGDIVRGPRSGKQFIVVSTSEKHVLAIDEHDTAWTLFIGGIEKVNE